MIAWERLLIDLGTNIVLLMALAFAYSHALRHLNRVAPHYKSLIVGLIFSVIAILCMNALVEITPGVVLDGRNVIVLIATVFGGPVVGLITTGLASAFRLHMGGVGTFTGIAAMASALGVGVAFHVFYHHPPHKIRLGHIFSMSLAVSLLSLGWMFSLPEAIEPAAIVNSVAIPVLVSYPLAAVFLGYLLRREHLHLRVFERLRKSEESFRDFAQASSDWFWETDEYRRFTKIALGNRKLPGLDPESYIGRTRESIAVDYTDNPKWQKLLQDIANHKPFQDFVYEVARDNGERVHISINGVPIFDEDGVYQGYRGTGTDITESIKAQADLVEAKEQAERFLDVAEAIIVAIDKNAIVTLINRRGCDVLGYSEDELLGQNWFDTVIPFEERREVWAIFQDLIKGGALPNQYFENRVLTKEGALLTVTWHNTVQRDKYGHIIGTLSSGQDITARKVAEEEMQVAKDIAESASLAKTEFLASMSHELRTPLNAVLGFAQVLQYDTEHPLTPKQRRNVEHVLSGGDHLLQLVNEILDLTTIEADQYALDLKDINANSLVRECVALSKPIGKTRAIELIDTFSDMDPITLTTDGMRLKQILINLLSNAIKYNTSGGTVTVEGDLDTPGYLRLIITDTGIGISPQDLKTVFGMFQRVGADPMITHEGTGIGLTVSKLLVERMAGQIGCSSMLHQGSSFWIKIPLASNDDIVIWNDQMRVGVDPIDKDHQILVTLLNKVITNAHDIPAMDEAIGRLIAYLLHHFRAEEEIMRLCRYPKREEHADAHAALIERVRVLNNRWKDGRDGNDLKALNDMLHDELLVHLFSTDDDIAPYTKGREREIKQALQSVRL
ncbi:PAS domain S-box protein [Magnetovibrio sp. PR-2]|uniref:PAS domain S-box protein n=1 Tax=Magnetovibrio sp. PR-2 TaxID=3120356 RepID=UPI002FCE18DD